MKKRKQNNKYNSNINKVKNNYTVNVQDANSYVFGSVSLNAGNRTGKFHNLSTIMASCFNLNLNTQTFNKNEDLKMERKTYLAAYFDKKTQENKVFNSLKEEFEYINFNIFNIIKDFLLKYKTEIYIKDIDSDGDILFNCYSRNSLFEDIIIKNCAYVSVNTINNLFKRGDFSDLYFIKHIEDIDDKFLDYLEELNSIDEKEELSDVLNSEEKIIKKRRL